MNNYKDETIPMIPKQYEQFETISKGDTKDLFGSFFATVGLALAIFILYHLHFDIRAIHHFYLLYIGIGAIISFLVGAFILHKSK